VYCLSFAYTCLTKTVLALSGAVGLRPLCVLVLLLPCLLSARDAEKLPSIQGAYFTTVGTDYRSVSFMSELSAHVVEVCSRYLGQMPNAFPQRILITLRPEELADFEKDYQIRVGPRGATTLDIRWSSGLSLEKTCFAVTEALTTQYSIYNYGPRANSRIPFWVVSALGSRCYLSLRPAQLASYVDSERASGPGELSGMLRLSLEKGKEAMPARAGYWILVALQQNGFPDPVVSGLVEKAVAGVWIGAELEARLQATRTDQGVTLQAWWESRILDLLSEERELYETMDVSLKWIRELSDFGSYLKQKGTPGNMRTLWEQRHDAELRSILEARNELIRLRLGRVNPAYFNAARSLGALYETVLSGKRADEFVDALATYLNDFEDAKRLHRKTFELLETH